jgi:hypothetical protein
MIDLKIERIYDSIENKYIVSINGELIFASVDKKDSDLVYGMLKIWDERMVGLCRFLEDLSSGLIALKMGSYDRH